MRWIYDTPLGSLAAASSCIDGMTSIRDSPVVRVDTVTTSQRILDTSELNVHLIDFIKSKAKNYLVLPMAGRGSG